MNKVFICTFILIILAIISIIFILKPKNKIFKSKLILTIASIIYIIVYIALDAFEFKDYILLWISLYINKQGTVFIIKLADMFYNLCISILAAMILVWIIDRLNEKEKLIDNMKREKIILDKIIPIVKEYYDLYIKMYIATREEKVSENDLVLKNLFNDKENLIKQIELSNLFDKDGYYLKETGDIWDMKSYPWHFCIVHDNKEFILKYKQIIRDYGFTFTTELLDLSEKLLDSCSVINNIEGLFNLLGGKFPIPANHILEQFKFNEVMLDLENLIKYIEKESGENILAIDIKRINEGNVSPTLGQALEGKGTQNK